MSSRYETAPQHIGHVGQTKTTDSVNYFSEQTALYRHFDKHGQLLYVGISLSAIARLAQHKHGSHWSVHIASVTIEQHPNRDAALAAEKKAIRRERPLHNIVYARSKKGEKRDCREPYEPQPYDPLIGRFGHSLLWENGERYAHHQFQIIGPASPKTYAVQLFSWLDGAPTNIEFVHEDKLADQKQCLLFATEDDWLRFGADSFRRYLKRGEKASA